MKRNILILTVVLAVAVLQIPGSASAVTDSGKSSIASAMSSISSETLEQLPVSSIDINAIPFQYTFVDGDYEKFQAQHWMPRGFVGGLEKGTIHFGESDPHGVQGTIEGAAVARSGIYEGKLELEKENWGFLNFEYEQFRKWYDGSGGVYQPFDEFNSIEVAPPLSMDIGKIELELGLVREGLPEITGFYEHEYKNGDKNRLTWGDVLVNGVQRKISPSWQELQENVDVLGIRLEDEYRGVNIFAEQRWECVDIKSRRYETNFSDVGVPVDNRITIQDQSPESSVMTSTLILDRWFWDDQAHSSASYQFTRLHATEQENLSEYDARVTQELNYRFPEQIISAYGENDEDVHTWVLNFLSLPTDWFEAGVNGKAEVHTYDGHSIYPSDDSPNNNTVGQAPDGVIDHSEASVTGRKSTKFGESFFVRYKQIPRTALYSRLDLEQEDIWLSEERDSIGISPSNGEIVQRETLTGRRRGKFTVGGNVAPWNFLNLATTASYGRTNNDFDNKRETIQGRTAFIDSLDIRKAQLKTRVTVKPVWWANTSFRYIVDDTDYVSKYQSDADEVETQYNSQIFVYDVTVIPHPYLILTGSLTRQLSETSTPASAFVGNGTTPSFEADYNTWMFNADFAPRQDIKVNGTFYLTRTRNYDNFVNLGLPYGADFDQSGVMVGVEWTPTEEVSVKPYYAYHRYAANPAFEMSDYNAHVIGFEATLALN